MGALKNNLLVSVLRGDIERFLNTNTELMFNERDLQVRVATWLRDSGHYDKVDMEYAVPKEELEARGLELKTTCQSTLWWRGWVSLPPWS